MPSVKLTYNNKKKVILLTSLVIFFGILNSVIPLFLLSLIPQSIIGDYIVKHLLYSYISIPILLYFLYTGIFLCHLDISSFVISIRSRRVIFGPFQSPNYIEISPLLIKSFAFFNRPFSFNTTLMIKMENDSGRKLTQRFNLTLLSAKEEKRISKVLTQIIAKNS